MDKDEFISKVVALEMVRLPTREFLKELYQLVREYLRS